MRYFFITILAISIFFSRETLAFSKSANELYQDILRLENDGNLPAYIRETRPLLGSDDVAMKEGAFTPKTHMQNVRAFQRHVSVSEERMPDAVGSSTWNELVKAVAGGRPSAFDIDAIKVLADNNKPEAVEMLAWMYAKGVGVNRNFKSAWFLYMRAADLEVENAIDNAQMIYASMTGAERRSLLQH